VVWRTRLPCNNPPRAALVRLGSHARRIPQCRVPLEAGATWERQETPLDTPQRGAPARGSASTGRAARGPRRSIGSSPTTSRPSRRCTTSGSPPAGAPDADTWLVRDVRDSGGRDGYGYKSIGDRSCGTQQRWRRRQSPHSSVWRERARQPPVTVGSLHQGRSLPRMSSAIGRGIVGTDLLEQYIVTFSIPTGQMVLSTPA